MKFSRMATGSAIIVFSSLILIIIYVTVGKLGVVGLPIFPCAVFSIIASGAGIFCGFRALSEVKKDPGHTKGKTLAILSISFGFLIMLGGLATIALFVTAMFTMH
jgi:hypothetical protein